MGPAIIFRWLSLVRRPRPRWLFRVLAVILSLTPTIAPCALKAQGTNSQEIAAHDEPAFKLKTERNLVMVHVVVRDSKGAVVGSLRKEDLQILDRGKLQTIVNFSLENPALKAPAPVPPKAPEKTEAEAEDETTAPASTARRFVALYFDDVNTLLENLARTRDAADHILASSVQAGDRVALFTSSGQKNIDFTADVAQLHQGLLELRSRPMTMELRTSGAVVSGDDIPPYIAYLVAEEQNPEAMALVTGCDSRTICPPAVLAQAEVRARRSLTLSETQATASLRGIEAVIRRMTSLPGQRSIVIVSDGLQTFSATFRFQLDQIIDRALRAGVIINAVDARGLYADPVTSDISRSALENPTKPELFALQIQLLREGALRQSEAARDLAHETGGIFFENSNDLDAGFRKTAGTPEAFYVLAFSPQNLKHDGTFHPLKVALVSHKGLSVQARRGYFAPKKSEDAASQEKEEIREAVFSHDEMHELPIDVHTQFFMKSETEAQLTVRTHIDLRPLHFRKEAGRNVDKLMFVTVVFDQDGSTIDAQKKFLELNMRDSILEKYLQTGITIRNLFDVKPGTCQVRVVVRESESGQISGLNRTVEIPY